MRKVIVYFVPDVRDILVSLKSECTLEESFEKIEMFCEKYKDTLYKSKISVYDEKSLMFAFEGVKAEYKLVDNYKEFEPEVITIYNTYYKDCHQAKKLISIKDLQDMNVRIIGYTMPDDYVPDFYKRCTFKEIYGILKEYVRDFPKGFSNLSFNIISENGINLFAINCDLETIYLSCINELNLTVDMVKEALGMEK